MRKTLLIACSAMLFSTLSNAQAWIEQNSNFTTISEGVNDISVVNDNVVWITGYDGSGGGANLIDFAVSSDGGNNFVTGTVGTDTTYQFSNISAISDDTAWVCMFNQVAGAGGGIWQTVDGGFLWTQQAAGLIYDANSFPNVVHFWNANEGWTMGDPNPANYFELYTTVDGGANWVRVPQANIPAPLSGEFGVVNWYDVIGDHVWFYTNKGRVYHSMDKGLNWTVAPMHNLNFTTQGMNVKFYDTNNGLANISNNQTGALVAAYQTSDGGATWTAFTPVGNFFTLDLVVIPGTNVAISTGAAQGFEGSSYSTDLGLTWGDIDVGIQHTALGASSYNGLWSGGFSAGFQSGGIFKFDGYNLGVEEDAVNLKSYNLYPNPSNGIVKLSFKSKSGSATVQVVDVMGKLVYSTTCSGTMVSQSFDFSSLAKGVYSLVIISGNEKTQEKLVIN